MAFRWPPKRDRGADVDAAPTGALAEDVVAGLVKDVVLLKLELEEDC